MKDSIFWNMVLEQTKIDYKTKLDKRKLWTRAQAYEMFVTTLADVIIEIRGNVAK